MSTQDPSLAAALADAARHSAAREARPWLFISDLHLSETLPRTAAAFEHFIADTASGAAALFILGDLFEYWIGDDTLQTPFAQRMAALMRTLSSRGTALYVMHGNRDFLLGDRFMAAAGARLLPDPTIISGFGTRIVLAHGDGLCTADQNYQRFRRFARSRAAQSFFLAWPLRWRVALAERMRAKSQAGMRRAPAPLYDVTAAAVAQLNAASGTHILVHGHTHLPARHESHGNVRWVLPDWDLDHGRARGGYLQLDHAGLRALPLA